MGRYAASHDEKKIINSCKEMGLASVPLIEDTMSTFTNASKADGTIQKEFSGGGNVKHLIYVYNKWVVGERGC